MDTTAINLTPMLTQYLEIKRQYPDAVLFYRMGDFYEMFLDDAVKAAPILEVQLTSRDRNSPNPIPMCGVPHHSASAYVQKLLARGLKVAICEQIEDPATAKGLVKRDVVRVVTPSLIGDPDLVPADSTNFLMCLWAESEEVIDVSVLDLLGGRLRHGRLSSRKALLDLFCEISPREILLTEELAGRKWLEGILSLFPSAALTIRTEYFKSGDTRFALERYLRETQKIEDVSLFSKAEPLQHSAGLRLDSTTLASLEILKGQSSVVEGTSLFDVVNRTVTPMGRRCLKDWLSHPLADLTAIEDRMGAVEEFHDDPSLLSRLKTSLEGVRDLERLTTKTALGLAQPRDLVAIRSVLKQVPGLHATLRDTKSSLLRSFTDLLSPLPELTAELEQALLDDPAANYREGGVFRESYHPEIASLRTLSQDAKHMIMEMEAKERDRTKIPSLKIKYSRVFGYTIEISKSHLVKVPPEYHRKQTIANGERYVTEDLKRFEEKVITAEHRLKGLEESLFLKLREKVATESARLLSNARRLGELDVLMSFALTARERGYQRPAFHEGWNLEIEEGRHPVVESLLPAGEFVPNGIRFEEHEWRTLILTGPNMAGKSTIMRQVALISILAQCGSFVPVAAARLPVVDAIFTRIGSSDDMARGRSTFMVEMTEVARILEQATNRSLILIDEIGRGTSTYDGLSLAWSLVEHIHTQVQAKTFFATHFHEITALENLLSGVRNLNVLVDKWKEEIVFLHKLGPGACSQSYGVEVARLAGLPSKVLVRAKEILGHLETQSRRADRARHRALETGEKQLAFFEEAKTSESQAGKGS